MTTTAITPPIEGFVLYDGQPRTARIIAMRVDRDEMEFLAIITAYGGRIPYLVGVFFDTIEDAQNAC